MLHVEFQYRQVTNNSEVLLRIGTAECKQDLLSHHDESFHDFTGSAVGTIKNYLVLWTGGRRQCGCLAPVCCWLQKTGGVGWGGVLSVCLLTEDQCCTCR